MKPASQLAGLRFGRLSVECRVLPNDKKGNTIWRCACDCGGLTTVTAIQLRRGATQSCGCLQKERTLEAVVTHGKSKTRTYEIWFGMIRRCSDQSHKNYDRYGGRGIVVCDRWKSFENFIADMGEAPAGYTIERENNDGPYAPDNCRWATRKEQSRNTSVSIIVEFDGRRMSLPEACELSGLKYESVYMRMRRGMAFAEAVSKNVERIRV
ncbi:hypothetical protein IVB34_12605 [Bradyrhizobium sp. 2]|uniref:hypothetical protein n=1 Tax=Bradyrhizobium sp. 2 TaxID=190045 RepID=UPI001FF7AB20|nr:hypothetical protein [Bradyrhizobium sp. 2]MCK1459130.1 hypothetical protein [Bradyrhizobium sp. 2]MCK1459196.1 hypothetical protein [Bradyrhizobium sp. 2]